jgi:cytochrome c5
MGPGLGGTKKVNQTANDAIDLTDGDGGSEMACAKSKTNYKASRRSCHQNRTGGTPLSLDIAAWQLRLGQGFQRTE